MHHASRSGRHLSNSRRPAPKAGAGPRGDVIPFFTWEVWPLFTLFFVALLWVGVVPKALAGESVANAADVLRLRVEGEWRSSPEKALADALEAAQKHLYAELSGLRPPIHFVPEPAVINDKLVVSHSPEERVFPFPSDRADGTIDHQTMVKMTLDLEVRPGHLRELRREERVASGGWLLGGVSALLAVVALFFRFDEWTRGYLTRWLALGAAGLVAVLGAAWWFLKG